MGSKVSKEPTISSSENFSRKKTLQNSFQKVLQDPQRFAKSEIFDINHKEKAIEVSIDFLNIYRTFTYI